MNVEWEYAISEIVDLAVDRRKGLRTPDSVMILERRVTDAVHGQVVEYLVCYSFGGAVARAWLTPLELAKR